MNSRGMTGEKLEKRQGEVKRVAHVRDIWGVTYLNLSDCAGPSNTKCNMGQCGETHENVGTVIPNKDVLEDMDEENVRYNELLHFKNRKILKWVQGLPDVPLQTPEKFHAFAENIFKKRPHLLSQKQQEQHLWNHPSSITRLQPQPPVLVLQQQQTLTEPGSCLPPPLIYFRQPQKPQTSKQQQQGAENNPSHGNPYSQYNFQPSDLSLQYNYENLVPMKDSTPKEQLLIKKLQQQNDENNNNTKINSIDNKKLGNENDDETDVLNMSTSTIPDSHNVGNKVLHYDSQNHVYRTHNDVYNWLVNRTWYRYDNRDDLYMLIPQTSSQSLSESKKQTKKYCDDNEQSTNLQNIVIQMQSHNEEPSTSKCAIKDNVNGNIATTTTTTTTTSLTQASSTNLRFADIEPRIQRLEAEMLDFVDHLYQQLQRQQLPQDEE